eukprot:scaffold914_cov218-Amphora_coffeaeformis.AAC.5
MKSRLQSEPCNTKDGKGAQEMAIGRGRSVAVDGRWSVTDMWKNMFMERDQDQMEAGRCSLVEGWGVPPIAAAGDGAAVAVGPPAPGTRIWTSYILFSTRPAT